MEPEYITKQSKSIKKQQNKKESCNPVVFIIQGETRCPSIKWSLLYFLIAGTIWLLISANTESVHTSIELKDLKTTLL